MRGQSRTGACTTPIFAKTRIIILKVSIVRDHAKFPEFRHLFFTFIDLITDRVVICTVHHGIGGESLLEKI